MFKFNSKLIIVVMLMFGITAFMSCEKENNNVKEEVLINDALIIKLAETHNDYLTKFVETYDYSNNNIANFKENFLKADLVDISVGRKLTILDNLHKITNKSTGISSLEPVGIKNLIEKINISNFSNKELLIEFLTIATNKVIDKELTCSELTSFLDIVEDEAIINLDKNEMIVLKSYFETLKASAYFWFSEDLGGSGIGYAHIQKLSRNKKDIPWYGSALISDATSMGIGMIGVAVVGVLAGPVGWVALAAVAGDSVANSAVAGAIQAGINYSSAN